jgi:signal transduction histidine kinase
MSPRTSAPDRATQIAHLRHELLTSINHVLGFTEMQIDEAPQLGLSDYVSAIEKLHERGRSLLGIIESELNPSVLADLARLNLRIGEEAAPALGEAKNLALEFHATGRESAAEELDLVSTALENLLALSRQMTGEENPDAVRQNVNAI